ncbi:MAG: glycerophosphodiester phosphodiesterase family protein [Desulfobacteraceae bacterium]|nr:glycerophosphodiester phosphodiesterase family protein [Desulfobacteraceae bacterium]
MVQIIAHRGARSLAPENTLKAARIAYETGADLWETDVAMTRDGHLILFHDDTLTRCTDAQQKFPLKASFRVEDFDLKEIRTLDAGSYFVETDPFGQISEGHVGREAQASFIGETIPLLEEGLTLTLEKNWTINLELKFFEGAAKDFHLPDHTLEIIRRAHIPLNRVIISSFHHPWLLRIMEKEPQLEVQALVGDNDTDPLDFKDFFFSTYNANAVLIHPDQILALKDRGKRINLFTVNDSREFSRFSGLGVDGIFTDFPQRFTKKNQ